MSKKTTNKKSSSSSSKKSSSTSSKKNTPNYQKQAIKTAKKVAKKNPKAFWIIVLVAIIVIGIGVAVYFLFLKDRLNNNQPRSNDPHIAEAYNPVQEDGISINFLELGTYNTGDCTYIKAGDVDILIDAGSIQNSAKPIKEFINQYCTDGKLEYVIATHAHKDHIAGFVGTSTETGIFESYRIGTLIEFARTDVTSQLYGNYQTKRDARIASGDLENYYTALQCVEETDGAKKEYTITDNISMTILDQKYYHEKSSDENNYSVCALFTHGTNHYLFTGDLEKEGEESLVELNNLPHCQLFKGGHHGSKTSNTDALLSKITPDAVCICCCAGNDEYTKNVDNQFPTQQTINNIAKYTSTIFVTTVTTDGHTGYTSMNGNINFRCGRDMYYWISGSNNSLILKDSEWFKNNRTWPEDGK